MNKTYHILALMLCLLPFAPSQAQNMALGEWRSLLAYTRGYYVTQTETELWFASDRGIIIWDKEENALDYLDKIDGLSDVGVQILEYNPENDLFIALYTNGNIDLIAGDKSSVSNISDIAKDTELQGDKGFYGVCFLGDAAYLATGFGVMKLDLGRREIAYTTFTNIRINSITTLGGRLYAATDEAIYAIDLENSVNPQDFGTWDRLDMGEGFPDDYSSKAVHGYGNDLFLDLNDTLFRYDGSSLEHLLFRENFYPKYMQDGIGKLLIQFQRPPYDDQKFYTWTNDGLEEIPISLSCVGGLGDAIVEVTPNVFWLGTGSEGLVRYEWDTESCQRESLNTPWRVNNSSLAVHEGELWVTGGNITSGWQPQFTQNGLYHLAGGRWENFNLQLTPAFAEIRSLLDVVVNPLNGKVYVGTFHNGILEYDRENFTIYNGTNTPMQAPFGGNDETYIWAPGVAVDRQGVLWGSNYATSSPVVAMQLDGTWKSFPVPGNNLVAFLDIDPAGNKWFTTGITNGNGNGLVAFHEGDDWDNDNDNQIRYFNTSNSELPTNIVLSVQVDKNGDVWVGTNEGVVIFECGSDPFNGNCRGTKRIVERADGNNAYLLETESVRAIAVDGANRKWVGTRNGVFLLSDDGLEELLHFTKENSPLYSNVINDIAIDPKTGEVYIGTEDGIIVYQGDATEGELIHSREVYAFPNPVRPGYEGPIAIRGLPENATVKITDVTGTLIYETTSNGGQAVWNGRDYNGRKAASGVYLVFSANEQNINNPDGMVTKILKLE